MSVELPADYATLVDDIKTRIRRAQVRANLSVNRELIILYWEIGGLITRLQDRAGWGAGVIPQLARDLKNELPELKGFSVTNLKRMTLFYREYSSLFLISPQLVGQIEASGKGPPLMSQLRPTEPESSGKMPQAVAQLQTGEFKEVQQLVLGIPWGHNILLIEKVKEHDKRFWYMKKTIENGWSRSVLGLQIESDAYSRTAQAVTNFELTLPEPQSDLAKQTLKDPYIFDFLTLDTTFRERELETGLTRHIEKFLLELGAGFAFVGRQVPFEVGEEEFYLDLLFYHLRLRCFVVVELKIGTFKPEYAGKMNFYLSAVDELMRQPEDKPSIGLILCQEKKRVVAEYALRGMRKPIGVSEYHLTRALPEELRSSLPSIEEIEAELMKEVGE